MGIELLAGVQEKLIRADEHLKLFDEEIARYAAADPYGIVRQHEDHIPEKSGRPGITWRAKVDTPPPLRLTVIAGDVLHNLRSALDHLAWALVLENGGIPSPGKQGTQFPILGAQPMKNGKPQQVIIKAKSGGASPKALTLLDALQPYGRRNDPLWLLNTLSIVDKHRTLIVTAIDLGQVTLQFEDGRTGSAARYDIEDGTLVFWVLEANPVYNPEVQVETRFSPGVAFRDARSVGSDPFVPAGTLLGKLLEFTRESIVQRFARVCFGGELAFPPI